MRDENKEVVFGGKRKLKRRSYLKMTVFEISVSFASYKDMTSFGRTENFAFLSYFIFKYFS